MDEIVGKRFGKLTVIKLLDDYVSPSGGTHKRCLCICDCGEEKVVLKEHLTSGRTKSCGCLKKEVGKQNIVHGMIHTRVYRIWGNMVNRCTNPNNPAWKNYGQRGITVCEEWLEFVNFYHWAISNGYNDSLTIDRIDNDKSYEPSNCRWVNKTVQANNKRSNHIVEYHNKKYTIAELAREYHIDYKVLFTRIVSRKWDVDRAVTQRVRVSNK